MDHLATLALNVQELFSLGSASVGGTSAGSAVSVKELLPIGFFGMILIIVVVSVIADTVRKVLQTRQREESRREIAAYVAEGSISPDDGVRLLAAGESLKDKLGVKL